VTKRKGAHPCLIVLSLVFIVWVLLLFALFIGLRSLL
jgi:hypothetical protein